MKFKKNKTVIKKEDNIEQINCSTFDLIKISCKQNRTESWSRLQVFWKFVPDMSYVGCLFASMVCFDSGGSKMIKPSELQ